MVLFFKDGLGLFRSFTVLLFLSSASDNQIIFPKYLLPNWYISI